MLYTPKTDFVLVSGQVTCSFLVLAVCRSCTVCLSLLEHLQILPLWLVVQIRLPVLGASPSAGFQAACTLLVDLHRLE